MIAKVFRRGAVRAFLHVRLIVAIALCSSSFWLTALALNQGELPTRLSAGQLREHPAAPKVDSWLLDRLPNADETEFIVILADQADLTEARKLKIKRERRHRVRDELWNKAQQSQQPILQWLRARKIDHRPFYIVNAIWVKADAETALTLASRSDVARVEGNPQIRNRVIDPIFTGATPSSSDSTTTIETGITYSHAPQAWSLGYTGQGIVIGGADTGYRWTHAALKNQYRGWNGVAANHDYNWHDSIHANGGVVCGDNAVAPCDDTDHGTHTMGTAVGSDGVNNNIGMAPGAKWIGCRNMLHGDGTPARYIECMEFFLAPYPIGGTPAQGNPDLAPDITTNSWTCPTTEGCSPNTLKAAVEAQRAAGIFMVVAAGNEGSSCHTVAEPPAIYDAVYSIGALNNGTDNIASFSSRGSVTIDNSGRRKPDLSAPGTNVRSSIKTTDTSYANFSGTSMATPHVAGAVALLWSAQPLLRNDIDATENILNESAAAIPVSDCDVGPDYVPNNTYGYGRLDVKAAVDYALLRTTAVSAGASGAVTVTFYAGMNRTYRLEHKLALEASDWAAVPGVADLTATADGSAQFVDPNGESSVPQFYRVRILD